MPLWQSLFMDLGFSRRNPAKGAIKLSRDYTTLLANISSRQAISPTARAQTAINMAQDVNVSGNSEIAQFIQVSGFEGRKPRSASFNSFVANVMITKHKSL
jgi:hypothetical protein